MFGIAMSAACGSGDGGAEGSSDASGLTFTTSGTETSGSGSETGSETGQGELVMIEIDPLDVVVEVVDGVAGPGVSFTATAHYDDGTSGPLQGGSWSYTRPEVATINPDSGAWSPTADFGGTGNVRVEADGISASTTATVIYRLTYDPDDVPPDTKLIFDGATTPDPALAVSYPYDRTVFPRGLKAPLPQFSGGADTDLYRFRIEAPTFSYEAWQTAPNPSRLPIPELPIDVWQKMEGSVVTGELTVSYQRYDGTTAYLPIEHTWTLADADLTGMIYYWAVNEGDVLRLPVGADQAETFLEKPPPAGSDPASPSQCIACHSVSSDGSTIVASTYGSQSPWGTWNAEDGSQIFLSGSDFADVWYPADASGFQAISPDGTYVVTGQVQGSLELSLNNTTTPLAALNTATGNPVHPVWSHDGTKLAYGVRTDGSWLDFTNSSLWLTDVSTVTPGFSNPTQLVPADPSLPTVTYPTFAPDSDWIAFNKASQARTREAAGELWMVNSAASSSFSLAEANGAADLTPAQQQMNFEPTFMPVSVGGYYWLVFVSERPYGNTLTDQDPLTRRKQLWATAIDAQIGATDPSHPAFWLPGQGIDNNNMRGNWALSPCLNTGESCSAGYDCCDGFCTDGVCSIGPGGCSSQGNACDTDGDCCDDEAVCVGGFCSAIIP